MLGGQRSRHIVQIPNFVPLICGEGRDRGREEGMHLYISGGHERAGDVPRVNGLVPLVHMEHRGTDAESARDSDKPRLCHQGDLKGMGQRLAAHLGAAEDTQAGFPAQIVFSGR